MTHRKIIRENPQVKYSPDLVRIFKNKSYENKMKLNTQTIFFQNKISNNRERG